MSLNLQYFAYALLGLAAIAWICYRQMTWRPVDPARMWRGPLIFGVIGAGTIVTGSKQLVLGPVDIATLAIELTLSLAIGAVMGAIAHFRRLSPQAVAAYEAKRVDGGRGGTHGPVEYESRTGWLGLVLWFVLIAVRIGVDVFAQHLGAAAALSSGVILLVLAANRAARTAVFAYRLDRHRQSARVWPAAEQGS
ncbi:hypothetical protein [Gryllotalpicola ginsengisoli]|uniref:hypothetical protein n=1 Tax=Gryllotalpicola ginsengisoli TaxID=444608 RepID=UPI00042988BB|nr:hypothetical protein [Gryllotalpicola ginsengisoli]